MTTRRTSPSSARPTKGRKTVGLLTTGSLGENNRVNVFFEWSKVKLFDIPLAVNTGEGGCQGQTVSVCNRARLYPDLANVVFGTPLAAEPTKLSCQAKSKVNCLWIRRYSNGMSVVNVSDGSVTSDARPRRRRLPRRHERLRPWAARRRHVRQEGLGDGPGVVGTPTDLRRRLGAVR